MGACFIKYQQSYHATVRCWDDIKTDMTMTLWVTSNWAAVYMKIVYLMNKPSMKVSLWDWIYRGMKTWSFLCISIVEFIYIAN